MIKKFKYLILLLPLLFITNVNADCTKYNVDFNNKEKYRITGTIDDFYVTMSNNQTDGFWRWINNIPAGEYVISFDVSNINIPWDITYSNFFWFSNGGAAFDKLSLVDINSNTTHFVYKFSQESDFRLMFLFSAPSYLENASIRIKNFSMYTLSEYNSCVLNIPQVNTYTYTFKVDDIVYLTDTVEEGTIINLPEPPTKEGYTFTGWTLNGDSYTGGEIHSNIDIIANFTENIVEPEPEPESPSNNSNIDFSGLIPYLLLISALLMLIFLKDFIHNIFRTRR